MFIRVAKSVAAVEENYGARPSEVHAVAQRFFRLMRRGLFLPNSPTLMNAGRANGMLSACFVLPVPDSVEGIFDAVKQAALIQKAGGGTGFAFDSLRPTGDLVRSSGGSTSGPISFWKVFAEATNAIQQGAFRRGANMGMMSVEHPDILKFIVAKRDPAAFANFNVSVKITDVFMGILMSEPNMPHTVVNPRTGRSYWFPKGLDLAGYSLPQLADAGHCGEPCYSVGDIWRMIVSNAHATGEPGICFIDRVNQENPTPLLGRITTLNACGEQPLLPWEACNLGSINVARFVFRDGGDMDWPALGDTVNWAVRFLDDVVEASRYPVAETQKATLGNRKVGLGTMGLADAIILLGMRYDSHEAVDFASKLMGFVQEAAHAASRDLAEERGCFPNWKGSTWDTKLNVPMRNASCTTIAPTGSLSVIGRCSSGIEPVYLFAFRRRGLDGQSFIQVHPLLEDIGTREGWLTIAVREALLQGTPAAQVAAIPDGLRKVLVTAHEVSPEWHVKMQAAVQEHVDNAVSKTVNLPSSATVEEVDKVYRMAYELGCKGITVYRDGSRAGQTLSAAGSAGQHPQVQAEGKPRPRTRVTTGNTSKFRMGCGTLFVTVNRDQQGLCEVFANLGKAGGCPSQTEATCRAVSTALRSGVDPRELAAQLRGIRCLSTARAKGNGNGVDVQSCPDAIARAIEEAIGEVAVKPSWADVRLCPDCGQPLDRESGCFICRPCGYSKCE